MCCKWYGIINKATYEMVKWNFLKKLDVNALTYQAKTLPLKLLASCSIIENSNQS